MNQWVLILAKRFKVSSAGIHAAAIQDVLSSVRRDAMNESADIVNELWEHGVPPAEFAARLRLIGVKPRGYDG